MSDRRRLFIASLATETNTFSPLPTGRRAYAEHGISKAASRTEGSYAASALRPWRRRAELLGWDVVESLSAYAEPLGRTLQHVYEGFRDEILADLSAAGDVDLILLLLHGAMVAGACDDCEGDLIQRIRALAPQAVIGVEIDPHCHLTTAMVEGADVVAIFKEYPHTDVTEVAGQLFEVCRRVVDGAARPVGALLDLAMIGFYPTFPQPMRGIVDHLRALEQGGSVLSASIAHGYPWGDVAEVGTRVLVYADGDGQTAEREAVGVAERLYAHRMALLPDFPDIASSLDRAAQLDGRVVLGDHSDNPGGGAPGDSTFFLREIVERRLGKVALGGIFDPQAARLCADAEPGARLSLRLGGKLGRASGDPMDLDVEVLAICEDHQQDCFGEPEPLGLAAAVRCIGSDIDIVITTRRTQAYGRDLFTGLGVDLMDKRLIVVKSSRHYEAAFGPIADHLWTVDSPGALRADFAAFPYTRRDGAYFPRVPDPWAVAGRPHAQLFQRRRSV